MEVLQLSCKNDAREFSCYCSLLGSDLVEVVVGCVELLYKSAVLVSLILSLEMGIFPCFSFLKVQLPKTGKCILWQLLSHKVPKGGVNLCCPSREKHVFPQSSPRRVLPPFPSLYSSQLACALAASRATLAAHRQCKYEGSIKSAGVVPDSTAVQIIQSRN